MSVDPVAFGLVIQRYRLMDGWLGNGLSRPELARACGVSGDTAERRGTGETAISLGDAERAARVLGTTDQVMLEQSELVSGAGHE